MLFPPNISVQYEGMIWHHGWGVTLFKLNIRGKIWKKFLGIAYMGSTGQKSVYAFNYDDEND